MKQGQSLHKAFGSLAGRHQQEIQKRLGSSLEEIFSLAGNKDEASFWEGALQFGFRLRQLEKPEAAAAVFEMLSQAPSEVREKAAAELNAIAGVDSPARRAEFLLANLAKQASDYRAIVPVIGGTVLGQALGTTALGRLAGSATTSFFSRGAGVRLAAGTASLLVEAPAFALGSRYLSGTTDTDTPWQNDLARAFLSLGTLRVFAFAGNQAFLKIHNIKELGTASRLTGFGKFTQVALPQAAMFAGMYGAHAVEAKFNLRKQSDGATTATDILASMISIQAGTNLGHRFLGPGFAAFQKETGMRAVIYTKHGESAGASPVASPQSISSHRALAIGNGKSFPAGGFFHESPLSIQPKPMLMAMGGVPGGFGGGGDSGGGHRAGPKGKGRGEQENPEVSGESTAEINAEIRALCEKIERRRVDARLSWKKLEAAARKEGTSPVVYNTFRRFVEQQRVPRNIERLLPYLAALGFLPSEIEGATVLLESARGVMLATSHKDFSAYLDTKVRPFLLVAGGKSPAIATPSELVGGNQPDKSSDHPHRRGVIGYLIDLSVLLENESRNWNRRLREIGDLETILRMPKTGSLNDHQKGSVKKLFGALRDNLLSACDCYQRFLFDNPRFADLLHGFRPYLMLGELSEDQRKTAHHLAKNSMFTFNQPLRDLVAYAMLNQRLESGGNDERDYHIMVAVEQAGNLLASIPVSFQNTVVSGSGGAGVLFAAGYRYRAKSPDEFSPSAGPYQKVAATRAETWRAINALVDKEGASYASIQRTYDDGYDNLKDSFSEIWKKDYRSLVIPTIVPFMAERVRHIKKWTEKEHLQWIEDCWQGYIDSWLSQ